MKYLLVPAGRIKIADSWDRFGVRDPAGTNQTGRTAAQAEERDVLRPPGEKNGTTRGNCELATAKTHSITNHFDGTPKNEKGGWCKPPLS
jgi:hypothetical protein